MSEYTPPPSAGGGGVGGSGNVIIQDIAQNVQFQGIIWASGLTYYGKNAKTNIVVSSGLEPSHVISRTIAEVGSGSANQRINVLIKAGDYFLTSGVSISGSSLTLLGEGPEKTFLYSDAITSKISGLLILEGHNQEIGNMEISILSGVYSAIAANGRAHLNIHNLLLNGPGETLSGAFGVKFNNSSSSFIKNVECYSFNDGIHLLNCQANHVEDIYSESFGTLVKLIGSSTRDNTVEFVDATATSYLSGIVGIISGADNNMVHSIHSNFEMPCVYLDAVSGTRQNRISDIGNTDISGVTILNNSPGVNYIGAYYPDVGISDVPRFTIWVSGAIYQAIRNTDGVMIASGTNAANVFKTVMNAVGTSFDGMVYVKAGDYNFTSGFGIGGGVTLYGDPNGGSVLSFDSQSGLISGAIRISGARIAMRDLGIFGLSGVNPVIYTSDTTVDLTNIDIDNNDGTVASGHIGIHIAGHFGGAQILRDVSVYTHDTGIYVASGNPGIFDTVHDIIMDGIELGNCNTGILLDSAFENIITNVVEDGSAVSGVIRLINGSTSNIISNVKGGSATVPTVVLSSGISGNIVSNIKNIGEGLTIVSSGTNRVAAYYPSIGASIGPTVTVWTSGSLGVNAMRNNDGVIIASGEFDAVVQTAVLETAKVDGTLLIKAGAYSVSSGIAMSGDIRLMGEGHSTSLQCDLGCTSGVIKMREGFQEVSDLEIQTISGHMLGIYLHTGVLYGRINNIMLDGATIASGSKGIFVNNNGPFNITDIREVQNFDTGIYLDGASAVENCIDNVRFVGCNAGIRGARIKRNRINDIYGDSHVSGLIILESGSTNNTVNNIIGRHTTRPVVLVQTSGINNVITNVTNASGGPAIMDMTSGVPNFLSPGTLAPIVLISGDSPFTYLNASGRQEMVTVGGGTVNSIDFVRAGTTTNLSGLVAGSFILNGGDKLVINHSGMPTMNVIPTG